VIRNRVQAGLEEILSGQDGKVILIVTHIGLLMSTIGDLCPGVDRDLVFAKESQNCAITEVDLRREDGRWTGELVRWSDYTHLYGEAANFTPPLVHIVD
jgi:broad specificity phosphatase PhoE